MRVSGWLPPPTNRSMIAIILIPRDIDGVVEVLEAGDLAVDRLLPLIDIVSIIILRVREVLAAVDVLVICATNGQVVVALSHRITSSPISPLLPEFGLRDGLGYRVVAGACVLSLIEEVGGHHHLLLVPSIRGLPLIDQIEKVRLIIVATLRRSIRGADAVAGLIDAEAAVSGLLIVLRIESIHSLPSVWRSILVASIALPNVLHEVAVEHGLPHLLRLSVVGGCHVVLVDSEAANSRLIEHLLLLLVHAIHVWQHLVDPAVVGGLKHDALLSCVHLVDAEWPISIVAALLSHAVGHEESLVLLLGTEPINSLIMLSYLHSIHPLCRRLTLGSAVVLPILMNQSVSQWRIRHDMLVHGAILEVTHHILQPRLGRALSALLLDFVHLLQILLRCWVQLGAEVVLGMQRPSFRLAHLVHLKSAAHGGVHQHFAWSMHLLEAIQSDIVQIAGAVQIPLFVSHDLLEKVVSPRLPLLLFQQQIVSRSDLVVLIILNICNCLVQIAVWTDARCHEAILNLAKEFLDNRHAILTHHNSFHFVRFDL